jgi:hypothetical protein
MLQLGLHVDEHGMAATDDERDVGLKPAEVGGGRIAENPRRIKMGFVMLNAQIRFAQSEGDSLRGSAAHHQRAGQAGTLGGGDDVELRGRNGRCSQRGLGQRRPMAQMLARGQFRDYAAIFGMELDLGRNQVGQDASRANDRSAGFVARRFKGKNGHVRR